MRPDTYLWNRRLLLSRMGILLGYLTPVKPEEPMDQQHWSSSSSLTLVLGDKPHVIHSEILNQLSFCNTEHASLRNVSQWLAPPPIGVGTTSSIFTRYKKIRQTCIATLVLWVCLFIILYCFVILYRYCISIPPNHTVSPWTTRTYNFLQQMAVQTNA